VSARRCAVPKDEDEGTRRAGERAPSPGAEPGATPAAAPGSATRIAGGAPRPPSWIAHAGFARERRGGVPRRADLDRCLAAGVAWIEVDVQCSADSVLVLCHDRALAGVPVDAVALSDLRRIEPHLLTLDEAVEHLGGRVPVMLDIKDDGVGSAVARWLAGRRDPTSFAVTGESTEALDEVRRRAPRVERWPSFPDFGCTWHDHLRVAARALAAHLHPRTVMRGTVMRAIGRLWFDAAARRPRTAWALLRLCGLPWWEDLPLEIARRAAAVGASGACVHHWMVTPHLVDAAERRGLPIATWTVNRLADLAYVLDCGVGLVTTDRVVELRRELGAHPTPRWPPRHC
jgi:glycerophosphoryl diester phosphodiesterase